MPTYKRKKAKGLQKLRLVKLISQELRVSGLARVGLAQAQTHSDTPTQPQKSHPDTMPKNAKRKKKKKQKKKKKK